MSRQDRLLIWVGAGAGGLLVLIGCWLTYLFLIGAFFTLSPEAQSQGNWWLANGLSAGIENALGDEAPEVLEQNCSPPMEGFAPAPECIFVRGTGGGPNCMRWDEREGRCNVVELREGLLHDARVLGVITDASRAYCHYIGPDNRGWETVVGCRAPGGEWRLHARRAPNTICVVASNGVLYRLAFAIRDGRRIRDKWCERAWIVTQTR